MTYTQVKKDIIKKYFLIPLLILSLATGCGTVGGVFGKSATKEQKQATKIEKVEAAITSNSTSKLKEIGNLSWGVDYALQKAPTNSPPFVTTAKNLNTRILTLAPNPLIDDMNAMKLLVDEMNSNSQASVKLLSEKDQTISKIQSEAATLEQQKDNEIFKYMDLAQSTAIKADTTQTELNSWTSWWGLGGIFKGFKMFASRIILIVIILAVLFVILRFASASSPIAASIFSIFDRMGSWVINIVASLAPKAIDKAGAISKKAYDEVSLVLKKIVDNLQNLKQLQEKVGHDLTLKELFTELDKSMDASEKQVIDGIKKELGY